MFYNQWYPSTVYLLLLPIMLSFYFPHYSPHTHPAHNSILPTCHPKPIPQRPPLPYAPLVITPLLSLSYLFTLSYLFHVPRWQYPLLISQIPPSHKYALTSHLHNVSPHTHHFTLLLNTSHSFTISFFLMTNDCPLHLLLAPCPPPLPILPSSPLIQPIHNTPCCHIPIFKRNQNTNWTPKTLVNLS